jgi:O-antigen/teichoic acid export membrane protein
MSGVLPEDVEQVTAAAPPGSLAGSEISRATAVALRRVIFLAARLVPNLLGAATAAMLTRILDPAQYGLYALALSINFLLAIGVFEWLGLSLLRMVPGAENSGLLLGTVIICFYGVCGACALAGVLVVLCCRDALIVPLIFACLLATFATAWFEIKQRLQLAELRDIDYFWMSSARGLITVVLVCSVAYLVRSPAMIVLALAASNFCASLVVRDRRLQLRRCRFDLAVGRRLFRFGFPLSISVGLAAILVAVDKWLLQALVGAQAVGFFTAATFIAQVPIAALAGGIGPSAYSMAVQALELKSPDAARAQLAQNFVVLLGIIFPGAAGIVALSNNLVHIMVGAAFWQPVIGLVPWLCSAAVFASLRAFYVDTAFQLAHRISPLIWTTLATLAANVVLDLWLIPPLGELGAAIGSCTALLVGLFLGAVVSRRVFRLPLPFTDTAKVLASTAIMVLCLSGLSRFSGPVALVLQIAVGVAAYAGAVVAFNVLGLRPMAAMGLAGMDRRIRSVWRR